MSLADDRREWLEADGLGGFASGTVSGVRTRRYHALLLTAVNPPTDRVLLVNGFEAWIEARDGRYSLSSHRYLPDVTHPDGAGRIESFTWEPWPRWVCRLENGMGLEHDLFAVHGTPVVVLRWKLHGRRSAARLHLRPLLTGRDPHATHHENPDFRFDARVDGDTVRWQPYDGLPEIVAAHDGAYAHEPVWFRNCQYDEERARGLDFVEDMASPGVLSWDLSRGTATLVLAAGGAAWEAVARGQRARAAGTRLAAAEKRRRSRFASPLHRAADQYLVRRSAGKTIVAGYPWFGDWGRDTFIALRGLCLATGRRDEARDILLAWAGAVSEGMLPNRFPDHGETPEYNSVDASLWYVVAAGDYLRAAGAKASARVRRTLLGAIGAILDGYARGTRYGIRLDGDGLLAAGVPGVQLTWMDARVGDWVVTPRVGKPVEVQALWMNALAVAIEWGDAAIERRWKPELERGLAAFGERFWNPETGSLHDVVDVDHESGHVDSTFRPNQIFAVGGLPLSLVSPEQSRRVVEAVEEKLWTPAGPRSLARGEPGYCPRYEGGVRERDGCYHQGTVWPWLAGPFVEAWLRAHGDAAEARERFVAPLLERLDVAGLGHLSEIADAEPPHAPRGCPFQAWSMGELLRVLAMTASEAPALATATR